MAKVKKVSKVKTSVTKEIKTIDFDTWAASGGTGGIFAKGVKQGRIRIIDLEI